jgi:hypothetical protein
MLPDFELIRLDGLKLYREQQVREADQWRLLSTPTRPTWLARQGCRLLCRLGGQLIRVGQYLQTLYESRTLVKA